MSGNGLLNLLQARSGESYHDRYMLYRGRLRDHTKIVHAQIADAIGRQHRDSRASYAEHMIDCARVASMRDSR